MKTLQARIKLEEDKRSMLYCASIALKTYKRKEISKWMDTHMKKSNPELRVSIQKPYCDGSFFTVTLWDDTLPYNSREQLIAYTYEEYVDNIDKRIEGCTEYREVLLKFSMDFDKILDRYEAAATEMEAIREIPGVHSLSEYIKFIHY